MAAVTRTASLPLTRTSRLACSEFAATVDPPRTSIEPAASTAPSVAPPSAPSEMSARLRA
ncbi:Uncharacterised protein [Bordetella pertussis]|nr:Uncharacterised protein [Bordetella pertussis]